VVLSTTTIAGQTVLRAALVNHRSDAGDVDAVIRAVLVAGARRLNAVAAIDH
jgi:aromatic-L-amino-acid/L-tryptophan decarboxylase